MKGIMVIVGGVVMACGGTGAPGHAEIGESVDATTSTAPGQIGWIATEAALRDISGAPGAGTLPEAYFDNPKTFDLTPRGKTPLYPGAIHTTNFTAVHEPILPTPPAEPIGLIGVLAKGCDALDPGVGAVLVDLESWDATPAVDNTDPVMAYHDAAVAVAAFNQNCRTADTAIRMVCTPGTDLVGSVEPACQQTGEDQPHCFIDLKLAAGIAPSCDVYEIQSQPIEDAAHHDEYVWYVEQAAAQARGARAGVTLYAGLALSSKRLGTDCDVGTLFDDVLATVGTVSGYWLNEFPNMSGDGCQPEAPKAIDLLTRMSAPRLVQEVGATETSGSASLTVPISTSRGDLLVLAASLNTGSFSDITGVTDSAGNAWVKAAGSFISGENSDGELWYTTAARPVSWVRADMAHSVLAAASVLELVNVAALDVTAGASGDSATPASGPSGATTQANELWVGMIANHDASPIEFTSPGWTGLTRHTSGTAASVRAAVRATSATASPSIQGSLQDAADWTAIVATFR